MVDSGQDAAEVKAQFGRPARLEAAPPELGLGPGQPVLDVAKSTAPPQTAR